MNSPGKKEHSVKGDNGFCDRHFSVQFSSFDIESSYEKQGHCSLFDALILRHNTSSNSHSSFPQITEKSVEKNKTKDVVSRFIVDSESHCLT